MRVDRFAEDGTALGTGLWWPWAFLECPKGRVEPHHPQRFPHGGFGLQRSSRCLCPSICVISDFACLHIRVPMSLCTPPLDLLAGVYFHRCLSLQMPLHMHMEVSIFAPVSFSM